MNYLKDFIGIRGYSTTPQSGVYVNQLPGISLKSMEASTTQEKETFVTMWNDVQERAWLRLESDFRNSLRKKFNIKTSKGLFHTVALWYNVTTPPIAKYRGTVYDTGIDYNGFFAFWVESITIDLPQPVTNFVLHLFDNIGNEMDSFQIANAVAGHNIITVKKAYACPRLFMAVDATNITLKQTIINNGVLSGWIDIFSGFYSYGTNPQVYGADANLATPAILQRSTATSGITASIMPMCDYSSLIYTDKGLYTNVWHQLLGATLMEELLFSDRINKYTTVDKEKCKELWDLFENRYQINLNDITSGIQVNANDNCIECRKIVTSETRIP